MDLVEHDVADQVDAIGLVVEDVDRAFKGVV